MKPLSEIRAERIVVRMPNWLGDVVLSLAALRDVRRQFPAARIEVLARASVAGFLGALPEVDAVRTSQGLRADARALRGAFDVALVFPNSFASALAPFWAGVPERWGFRRDARGFLLTRGAPVPASIRGQSQVYYYRAMLSGVGLAVTGAPETALRCPDAWQAQAAARVPAARVIAVSPGAAFGTAKRWRPEGFAAAADRLARERQAVVIVLGTAAERALGEAVASTLTVPSRVLCGETTLGELVGLLARAELLLTNDSGTMHVAAALGTPVVAVFGPTDWTETAPVGVKTKLVRADVHCAPCMLRHCPIDHRCMQRVSADQVVDAARSLA